MDAVLITGATSGIGLELAKLFAKDGNNLVIVARNPTELATTVDVLKQQHQNIEILAISRDLFDPENAFAIYDELKQKEVTVNVLVNDAGQGLYGEFADTDLRKQLKIIQLNISSLVALTHLFLNDMLQRGTGKILNLSSIAGKLPGPWQSVYHGTKAFVQSFTEAVRSEVKDKGIVVTALLPGATNTDFFNKAGMQDSKIVQNKEQLSDPADVAKDGYQALMRGDDMIVSGFKNKMQVDIAAVTPDEMLADNLNKRQEPVDRKDK
ncbi:MAG: oxidoreductase [Bacteroidetes bacterium 43-93]|nr:SDR family oxidoreductase [Bacteroidota bacterium]OJX01280.1 MAG: oxidoreductase [Bacteroidetes bacterium 43-93]